MAENKSETIKQDVCINAFWDNELIIKSYDGTNMTKEMLAKHIADSTNNRSSPKVDESNEFSKPPSVDGSFIFKVGDYVRATFTDGIDYEAQILSINQEVGTCKIKYIGYNNHQEVTLNNLLPTWGKKERRKQQFEVKQEMETKKKNAKPTKHDKFPFAMPPLPPMPPNLKLFENNENAEHLSAMLMSWYMSGFYTGVYQGLQMSKRNQKQK